MTKIPIKHYEEITNLHTIPYLFSNQYLKWIGNKFYKVTVLNKDKS